MTTSRLGRARFHHILAGAALCKPFAAQCTAYRARTDIAENDTESAKEQSGVCGLIGGGRRRNSGGTH